MKFISHKGVGSAYKDEETRNNGERNSVIAEANGELRKLKTELTALQSQRRANFAAGSRARQLDLGKRQPAAAPQPDPRAETQAERIISLRAQIIDIQIKMQREGAQLDSNGYVMPDGRMVVYDHQAEARDLTRLHFAGGLIYQDAACTQPFDTAGMTTHVSGNGWAIYVLSAEGHFHASGHAVGYRHHSSLLAGENVAGAGELKVEKGRLVRISNKSGHYHPGPDEFQQVLYMLEKRHVGLVGAALDFFSEEGKISFPSVQAFVEKYNRTRKNYEKRKLLAYFPETGMRDGVRVTTDIDGEARFDAAVTALQAKGWRFATSAELKRGATVVVDSGGKSVPHRLVRKYLKECGFAIDGDSVPEGFGTAASGPQYGYENMYEEGAYGRVHIGNRRVRLT
jgi:hypothetical protein